VPGGSGRAVGPAGSVGTVGPGAAKAARHRIHRSLAINAVGAVLTALVLVIVLITKFTHGAWLVVIAMPVLFLGMKGVRRHYDQVARQVALVPDAVPKRPARHHVVVLVAAVHAPTLKALGFAQLLRPATLTALTVAADDDAERLRADWAARGIDVPLTILHSPYREVVGPVLGYVQELAGRDPDGVVSVVIPEYIVGHWWEQPLHNQNALRLKARLLFMPGVAVIDVPYRLPSARR
ncbi:DNA-binding protein, partial [Streptomyces sp. 12297]